VKLRQQGVRKTQLSQKSITFKIGEKDEIGEIDEKEEIFRRETSVRGSGSYKDKAGRG